MLYKKINEAYKIFENSTKSNNLSNDLLKAGLAAGGTLGGTFGLMSLVKNSNKNDPEHLGNKLAHKTDEIMSWFGH